jgi:hypothetical protein
MPSADPPLQLPPPTAHFSVYQASYVFTGLGSCSSRSLQIAKEKLPPLCSRKLFLLIDLESCKNGGMFFAIRSSIAFSSRHLDRRSISQVKWHKDIAVVYQLPPTHAGYVHGEFVNLRHACQICGPIEVRCKSVTSLQMHLNTPSLMCLGTEVGVSDLNAAF